MSEGTVFLDLLKKLRAEQGVSLEQLCEGLCSRKMLSGFENDGQEIPLLLQDALLERLGIGAESSQEYVDYEEYDKWELRQRILHNITFENIERAGHLLNEYEQTCDMRDNLERQFVLSQWAQIRRAQGADREELSKLFTEAVSLTVQEEQTRPLSEMALSMKELNLMLEREQYRPGGPRLAQHESIVEYIEAKHFDRNGRAKIYPKAVCFWCDCAMNDKVWMLQQDAVTRLLERCNDAFEQLRDASRLCFMWELLGLREELLARRLSEIEGALEEGERIGTKEYRERGRLEKWQKENAKWKWVLNAVYTEFNVPKETWEYCYLYVKKGVNCYSDVIRIRRKMFGMTAKKLCEDICQEAVLRRLERRISKPHRYNVKAFFARLGLSTELFRVGLVTDSPEVRSLIDMLSKELNARRWEQAERLLMEIERKAPAEVNVNQQQLLQKTLMLQWHAQELTDEKLCECMRGALELTLPLKSFLSEGEKYLTNMEQTCIQNMMQAMKKDSEEFKLCMTRFREYYDAIVENELHDAVSGMYEHIMGYVSSELGNQGDYDASDEYNHRVTEGGLRFRRLVFLPHGLYGSWWNHVKRIVTGIPVERELDSEVELTKCILLCELNKQDKRTQFFRDKLERLQKGEELHQILA